MLESNALALEYQPEYGSARGDIDVLNLVNNPNVSGVVRVFGPGFFEEPSHMLAAMLDKLTAQIAGLECRQDDLAKAIDDVLVTMGGGGKTLEEMSRSTQASKNSGKTAASPPTDAPPPPTDAPHDCVEAIRKANHPAGSRWR